MTLEEFETGAKAAMDKVKDEAEKLWKALPAEFQHPALEATVSAISDLGAFATAEVNKVAPATAQSLIDDAIAAVDAKAESAIAAINNQAAADKAALAQAKELTS